MFTADDARKVTEATQNLEIEPIIKMIKGDAESGKSSTNYYGRFVSQQAITRLEFLGFRVNCHQSPYDEGNQLVVINW